MTIALVGDSHARKRVFHRQDYIYLTENGLPVWDILTEQYLAQASKHDTLVWSCGYCLMGLNYKEDILLLESMPVESRFIDIKFKGFYKNSNWQKLENSVFAKLADLWVSQIEFLTTSYPNITLLPLASSYYDKKLNFPGTLNLLSRFKQLDVSVIQKEDIEDEWGHLNKTGWDKIESQLIV